MAITKLIRNPGAVAVETQIYRGQNIIVEYDFAPATEIAVNRISPLMLEQIDLGTLVKVRDVAGQEQDFKDVHDNDVTLALELADNPHKDNPYLTRSALGAGSLMRFIGTIFDKFDFPSPTSVATGDVYRIATEVTDNAGAGYTNTGLTFYEKEHIYWDGVTWRELTLVYRWLQVYLELSAALSTGIPIDVQSGAYLGGPATVTGDTDVTFPATASVFNSTAKAEIFLNGIPQLKGVDVFWVSTTKISFNFPLQPRHLLSVKA